MCPTICFGCCSMDVKVVNVQKKYRRREVLKDVTFSAGPGDCVGILGGNGSGKSTLLKTLAGVLAPDGGAFFYGETDLFRDEKRRAAAVGYVPQGTPLLRELTAMDHLRLWYAPEALRRGLSGGVLSLLGIPEFLKVPVGKMSEGMKKRLSIGCALASNPGILLLDEPSAALDLVCKAAILDYFRMFRDRGGILVIATHDPQELELCTGYRLLRDGVAEEYLYRGDLRKLSEDLKS